MTYLSNWIIVRFKRGGRHLKAMLKDRVNVKILIAERGMSLRDFSKKIEISQGYLSQILNGDKTPSTKIAFKISSGLEVEMKSIFFINID